jgi:hypothetical protein
MEHNPYAAPEAETLDTRAERPRAAQLASGQKLVIYALLVNLGTIVLQVVVGPGAAVFGVVAMVMSIIGMIRIGRAMGMSRASRIFLVLAMLVPLVNLITLLVLNSMATRQLRSAGYRVGLLGASK